MKNKRSINIIFLLCGIVGLSSCVKDHISPYKEKDWYAGGSQTVFVSSVGAYGEVFPDMSPYRKYQHSIGDKLFESTFVSAPAQFNQGLGPIFNNVSCSSCHINDGRGAPPAAGTYNSELQILMRLSIPGQDQYGGPLPAPGYGTQLQIASTYGTEPEADLEISYTYVTKYFADGTPYELRVPSYSLKNMYAGSVSGLMMSPRVAPPVFGLGLLEAIPEEHILALQDINDANGDGISGKANMVWSYKDHHQMLGRFGWKANVPTILEQVAGALHGDMGITSSVFQKESSYGQSQYIYFYDHTDISDSLLYLTSFYVKTLAVPARRNVKDAQVIEGKKLFAAANCVACHTPQQQTATNVKFPALSNQVIYPYTDLLVHDMGPELADNRPDFEANGQEWRTPPLWGIGLTEKVNGHTNFLHDGRARNLVEAIMWHGGEASAARDYFNQLPEPKRQALIAFLQSL